MTDFFDKLTEKIKAHDRIILMTHSTPDLDGMGSAIAFSEIIKKMGKEVFIVAPKHLINKSLVKAIDYLEESKIIIPFKYEKTIEPNNDLLIIFDTEEKNLVECEELLNRQYETVVIDHHSKGINTIDSDLKYLEETKSSTIEIVCEYLIHLEMTLNKYIYTVMYAGLYIDSNGFSLKTTPRTFEIAAYLLENKVENIKWQSFLKIPMEEVLNMYSYIENCVKLDKDIYLCEINDHFCTSVDLAIIANKIQKIEGVKVAFAIGMENAETVLISARSNGEVDVSKIMNKFKGGGHHSGAAAKIQSDSIEEVITELKKYIRE